MCGEANETVTYITDKCTKPAQKGYKRLHGWIGRSIHWKICGKEFQSKNLVQAPAGSGH